MKRYFSDVEKIMTSSFAEHANCNQKFAISTKLRHLNRGENKILLVIVCLLVIYYQATKACIVAYRSRQRSHFGNTKNKQEKNIFSEQYRLLWFIGLKY